MPINGATQKEFMESIYQQGKVNLDEALQVFYKSKKQRNIDIILSVLGMYEAEDEIIFIDTASGNRCSLSEEMIENAGDYEVLFNDLNRAEKQLSEDRSFYLNDIDIDDLGDGQYMANFGSSTILIYGETDEFMPQHERLRAFANMVAQHLIGRRFEKVASFFSELVADKFTPEAIENKLLHVEKNNGTFDLFDRVEVQSLYLGKDRGKKYFDDEKMPKGVERSQRVGTALFQLVSDHTPNGVSHWDYTVFLNVMEEDKGLFKIYDMSYRNTY